MYDYDPELCVDDSGYVHIIWARKPNTGGAWQLMYGRRDPATEAWDTVGLGSPTDAWQPHIACKGETLASSGLTIATDTRKSTAGSAKTGAAHGRWNSP
jgi:hypothetical protein